MMTSKWLRIFLPATLIAIWFTLAGAGGPIFGKLPEVSSNDQASFLPASAESTQVQQLQSKFNAGQSVPAIVIIESEKPVTPAMLNTYKALGDNLSRVEGLQKTPGSDRGLVVGPIPSKDGKAVEFIAPVANDSEPKEVVGELRNTVRTGLPDGARAYVTGPAGLVADLAKAFGGIDGILLAVAVSAVFVILLVVYRSLLLPFLVLFTSLFALCAAILVVYLLAKNNVIQLNGQSQGILSILVIGAATDYSLLIVARYREALNGKADKWQAMAAALKGSFEPILASAATVVLALLCLLFSDLNSNRSLGPIAATGIVFSFLAALTLLPALLVAFGRAAFWPSKITSHTTQPAQPTIRTGFEELGGFWKRAGHLIAAHPRRVWIFTTAALVACSFGLLQLKAEGVPQTDIILSQSEAVDGQEVIAKHFSAGSGTPVVAIAPQAQASAAAAILASNPRIADVSITTVQGRMAPYSAASSSITPKVVDGKVQLYATLKPEPYSTEAESTVRELRRQLADTAPGTIVGGTTALNIDTDTTAREDLVKIVPIVLVVILVVLMLLLRAVVAPILLIATVVVSFAATLGVSALVFNHIFHFPGADPAVPLFGFVFLVALGVDYNIFLMTRAREEALRFGTRPAMLHSLGKTGGVITSAGIVLAATFAALGIIPILFLVQLAFIVAFGVLLDTLVVRTLLVPALVYDFGAKVWLPSLKIK